MDSVNISSYAATVTAAISNLTIRYNQTIEIGNYLAGTVKWNLSAFGNIVVLGMHPLQNLITNSDQVIGTIPSKYAPKDYIYAQLLSASNTGVNGIAGVTLYPGTGNISVHAYNLSAVNARMQLTWFI